MVEKKDQRQKSKKGFNKKWRDILGVSADTIQIIQFFGSTLKTILAATAVVGGTVIVGKTITNQEINLFKKDTNIQQVAPEPTLKIDLAEQDIKESSSSTLIPRKNVKPIIKVDSGWGHPAAIFNGPPESNPLVGYDYTVVPLYVTIYNMGTADDYLVKATSDSCQNIYYQDMTSSSSQQRDNKPTSFNLKIPENGSFEMKFMGQRLVCDGAHGIKVGSWFKAKLFFSESSEKEVSIEIRQTPE